MRKKIFLFTLIFLCAGIYFAAADTIYLKSGQVVEGEIVIRGEDFIKLDTDLGITLTYYFEDIDRINEERIVHETQVAPPVKKIKIEDSWDDEYIFGDEPEVEPEPEYHQALITKLQAQEETRDKKTKKDTGENIQKERNDYIDKQMEDHKTRIKEKILRSIVFLRKNFPSNFYLFELIYHDLEQFYRTKGLGVTVAVIIGIYLLFCFPMMMLADKFNLSSWMAWIPILQVLLFIKMGEKPIWWLLLLLIPGLNIIVFVMVWMRILLSLHRAPLLGILMIIPGVNILFIWYLALMKSK